MQDRTNERLAALLAQTGAAHGEYEQRELGGRYDENWPSWYAAYLLDHGGRDLFAGDTPPSAERLGGALKQLDEGYRREKPAVDWPVYYARRLAAVLG